MKTGNSLNKIPSENENNVMLQEEENGLEEEEAEEGEDPGDLFNLDPGSKIIPSIGTKIRPTSVYVTRMSTVYTTVVSTELMLDWLDSSSSPTRVFLQMYSIEKYQKCCNPEKGNISRCSRPPSTSPCHLAAKQQECLKAVEGESN